MNLQGPRHDAMPRLQLLVELLLVLQLPLRPIPLLPLSGEVDHQSLLAISLPLAPTCLPVCGSICDSPRSSPL